MKIQRRGYRRADGTLVKPTAYEAPAPETSPETILSLATLMAGRTISKDRQGRLKAMEELFGRTNTQKPLTPKEKRKTAEEKRRMARVAAAMERRIQQAQAPEPEPEEVKPKLMRRAFDFE